MFITRKDGLKCILMTKEELQEQKIRLRRIRASEDASARRFVLTALEDGPLAERDVRILGREMCLSWRQLVRAAKQMGVEKRREAGRWFWVAGTEKPGAGGIPQG